MTHPQKAMTPKITQTLVAGGAASIFVLALVAWRWFTRTPTMRLLARIPLDSHKILFNRENTHIFFHTHDLLLRIDHADDKPFRPTELTLTNWLGVLLLAGEVACLDKVRGC